MTDSGVRQLKAIMFTDIKDFSAMMGQDEQRTMRLVQEHREIVRATLPEHSGYEHETIGDAFVVLFDSAVNAVQCAAEIQTKFRVRNAERPEQEQVWIRIGIHVGDIILQDGDIYGDGVNIAARVEPQAEPGGICITQDVFVQVQKKVSLRAISIGKKELKNITEAPELYRILLEGDAVPDGEALAGADGKTEWPVAPLWKKIVWFVITLPLALSIFAQAVLTPDGARGLQSAFGLSEDLPTAVGMAFGFVLSAGLVFAAFAIQRFWSRGVTNRWLHGPLFLVFPGAGLLLTLYHLLTLNGQLESYLTTATSYGAITETQASKMSTLVAGSIARFLNAVAVDQLIVGMLALVVLLGFLFVKPMGRRSPGSWKRWLLLPAAVLMIVICQVALTEWLEFMGVFLYLLYLIWILAAVAVLRLRQPRAGSIRLGWQAFRAGVITVVAWSGVQVVTGYVMWFGGLGEMPRDLRQGIAAHFVVPGMNAGLVVELVLLALLFVALLVVCRRVLPLKGLGTGVGKAAAFGVGIVVVVALPQVVMPGAMLNWDKSAIPRKLSVMQPQELEAGAGESYYIDKESRGLWFGRRQLLESLTGLDRLDYEDDAPLFDALSGGERCPEQLSASVLPDGEDAPAVCITAIEARLYCEGLGQRLPTAAEWEAALGEVPPGADDSNGPFTRGPFAEWTMTMTHGTPTFEVRGAAGVAGASDDLKPDQFSDKVGFRCAFTFGPAADVRPPPAKKGSADPRAGEKVRKTDSLFTGRLYIDRIAAGEGHEGIAAAVAAKLAERFHKHFGEGVLTSSELGSASPDLERSAPAERPKLLAEATKASRVLVGELVDIDDGLWVNLAFYDAKQKRVVDRISERAGATPESVLAALERGLEQILLIPVGEKGASKELITKLIHSKIGLVRHCYNEALQRKPKLDGTLTLELTISAEGVFDSPGITLERTTLHDPRLHRCVIDGLSGIETGFTFEGPTTAHYPFEFHPGV